MNALKVANGLILDFTLSGAGGSDAFLLAASDGTVKSLSSIPVSRLSGGNNLVEATSSVLTISGGTGAVLGSGVTIQVLQASGGQSGYLSSADWTTFNGKLDSALTSAYIFVGNGSNVATGVAVAGDVTISNAGVTAISANVIVNADINSAAAIAFSKMAALSTNLVTATNGSGIITTVAGFTTTIAGYLTNITSDIQTQVNGKLSVTLTSPSNGDIITYNGSAWINSAAGSGTLPVGGTANQFLTKINSTNYNAQWHTLVTSDVSDLTATAAELNMLHTVTTTTAQFNYLNTTTSDVQSQLNLKQSSILPLNSLWVGNASNLASVLAAGSNGQVLQIAAGVPTWQTITGTGTVTSVAASGGTTGLTFSGSPITTSGTLTLSGILAVANGGTGSSTFTGWLLASGGILTGANTITGTTSNTIKYSFSSLGTTQTDGAGLWLQNSTAAAAGSQQISPAITWEGQGWATTPVASQIVKFIADVLPIQGTATATATWRLRQSLNGASYADVFTVTSGGVATIANYNSSGASINFQTAGVERARITNSSNFLLGSVTTNAQLYTLQSALSSSWIPAFRSDPGAHTGMTAATEFISRDFQGAVQTWSDGTTTTQRFNYFRGYTLNKTTTSATFTNAYTLYVDPLTAGSGVTITNNYALGVNGAVNFTDKIALSGSFGTSGQILTSNGSGSAPTWNTAASGWSPSGATTITGNTSQSGSFTNTMSFDQLLINQNANITSPSVTITVPTATGTTAAPALGASLYVAFPGTTQYGTTGNSAYRSVYFSSGALTSTSAWSPLNLANLEIVGAFNASTNVTATNSHSILVTSSNVGANVTNSYGLTVNAMTGATNNYAAQFVGGLGVKLSDINLVLGTSTGTKIGTSTSQKLGFYNATPIVQITTGVAAASFVANTSGTLNDSATWDGYTIGQVVKSLRNYGFLA